MLTLRQKKLVINEVKIHEKDTGSAAVQIGLLTKKINELAAHLKKHSKDHHSRRGLLKMVGRRRRLLKYLQRQDEAAYNKLLKKVAL